MHLTPSGIENETFVSDALETIRFKFVSNEDEVNSEDPTYAIEYAHKQFGDMEQIFGYKDLKVTLCFTEATLFPHLLVNYSEAFKGEVKPDDIALKLESELVKDQKSPLRKLNVFTEKLTEQTKFAPYGSEISAASVNKLDSKREFALFRMDGELSEEEKLFVERIQSVLYFYIELAQYTDSDDDRFVYYVLFERYTLPDAPGVTRHRVAGYASLYKYYHHPDQWRLRVAQIFVFPQFRKSGVGAAFVHAINADVRRDSKIYDLTAEAPELGFLLTRDFATVLELIDLKEFSKERITSQLTPSADAIEAARLAWKVSKKEVYRAVEIINLAIAETKTKSAVEEFKDALKKRLKKPFDRKKNEYWRHVAALGELDDGEGGLAVANQVEDFPEAKLISLRDNYIEEYKIVINRLLKHSNAFAKYIYSKPKPVEKEEDEKKPNTEMESEETAPAPKVDNN